MVNKNIPFNTILCSLVVEEIANHKQVEWVGTKFARCIDIGTQLESDRLPDVKDALVFVLVRLNDNWKIPVVIFFFEGLTGADKPELVNKCSICVYETGV